MQTKSRIFGIFCVDFFNSNVEIDMVNYHLKKGNRIQSLLNIPEPIDACHFGVIPECLKYYYYNYYIVVVFWFHCAF